MDDTKTCKWSYSRRKATLETQCKMLEPDYEYIDRDALYAVFYEALLYAKTIYCPNCGKKIISERN